MEDRVLDYVALVILITVAITILYAIIYIHDIPYEIAKKRNHPHQDALHTAGWVSLFLMHTIWPFLWIWATLYKPDKGWGMLSADTGDLASAQNDSIQEELSQQLAAVKDEVAAARQEIVDVKATLAALEQKPDASAEEM